MPVQRSCRCLLILSPLAFLAAPRMVCTSFAPTTTVDAPPRGTPNGPAGDGDVPLLLAFACPPRVPWRLSSPDVSGSAAGRSAAWYPSPRPPKCGSQ
ncbi:hypothetical protein PF008_g16557 [Phytophthora fragariae]|uniref:RxLR effector protein n=1 Tax=Phytophthora fragariae TaxID=53985 RepID=A0A6G0RAU0_9STRA|nr:hypothetical protein PF008_g16557 [Phytophthora fragariae]